MARKTKQKKRSYGTGTVLERGSDITIGWREAILQAAVVNNVVSGGMSGLLLETSFKHRVELMKGFLNASVDLGPTAVFQ